jgi:hypothetical protein
MNILDTTKERISELEDKLIETFQTEWGKKKGREGRREGGGRKVKKGRGNKHLKISR